MGVDADALQADGSYLLEDGEGVVKADGEPIFVFLAKNTKIF